MNVPKKVVGRERTFEDLLDLINDAERKTYSQYQDWNNDQVAIKKLLYKQKKIQLSFLTLD